MEPEQNTSLFGLNIDMNGSAILRSAAQWAKALAILGIIIGVVSCIFGFLLHNRLTTVNGRFSDFSSRTADSVATLYLIVFIIYGVVFFISSIFLFGFSNKTITGLNTNDQVTLNAGFNAIKNGIIFWTIIFIVFLLLLLLALAGTSSR